MNLKSLIQEEVKRSLTEAVNQRFIDAIETEIDDLLADTEMSIEQLEAGRIDLTEFKEDWFNTTTVFTNRIQTIIRNIGKS